MKENGDCSFVNLMKIKECLKIHFQAQLVLIAIMTEEYIF